MRYLPFFVLIFAISLILLPKLIHHPVSAPPTAPVTIGLVGDIGLGRYVTATARAKNDFSWSFQKINPWLSQNDLNLGNLEGPIINNCPTENNNTFVFCADPKFIPHLNHFVLNLNNNHILNYGLDGLNQTKSLLPQNSCYDNFLIKKINGLSFGFLGFDFITYPKTDSTTIIQKIKLVRPNVDFLIISIHWGNEYLTQPESWRINLAHQLIDAGADIIHGHHPHVWQGVETYKNELIFYSLGNFIFDQDWSYDTTHSQIARVTFQKGEPLKYKLFPIEIKFNSQPALMP